MQVSYFETGRYYAPSNLPRQWPMPAGAYDREAGLRAFRGMVERSARVPPMHYLDKLHRPSIGAIGRVSIPRRSLPKWVRIQPALTSWPASRAAPRLWPLYLDQSAHRSADAAIFVQIGVSMTPGWTVLTRIWSPLPPTRSQSRSRTDARRHSRQNSRPDPRTAGASDRGHDGDRAAPAGRIAGTAYLTDRNTPSRLTRSVAASQPRTSRLLYIES